jgi:hypothetical protein
VAAKVGQGFTSPHGLQVAPQAFPAQGSTGGGGGAQPGTAARQLPAASQRPAIEGAAQGGVAERHGGSIVQAAPQAWPSQGAVGGGGGGTSQPRPSEGTHRPERSQAFTTSVSTQPRSAGSQTVQVTPQAWSAQGS